MKRKFEIEWHGEQFVLTPPDLVMALIAEFPNVTFRATDVTACVEWKYDGKSPSGFSVGRRDV